MIRLLARPLVITSDVISRARALLVAVYTINDDNFVSDDLGQVRACKFLNNKSTLLKMLPPTEHSLLQQLMRTALATIINRATHVNKPTITPSPEFRWSLQDGKFVPVTSTQQATPQHMTKIIACGCTKGCQKNCYCSKTNVPCYLHWLSLPWVCRPVQSCPVHCFIWE